MKSDEHKLTIDYDSEGYAADCSCGKWFTYTENQQDAVDEHQDHVAGVYEN